MWRVNKVKCRLSFSETSCQLPLIPTSQARNATFPEKPACFSVSGYQNLIILYQRKLPWETAVNSDYSFCLSYEKKERKENKKATAAHTTFSYLAFHFHESYCDDYFFFTAHIFIESEEFPLSAFPEQCPVYNNYVCCIFITLGIINDLEAIQKICGRAISKDYPISQKGFGYL